MTGGLPHTLDEALEALRPAPWPNAGPNGPGREHLLVYPEALAGPGWVRVQESFGAALIELGEADARRYAANAFTYTPPGQSSESVLVMPGGVSERLLDQVRERGVTPISADVSEFLKSA